MKKLSWKVSQGLTINWPHLPNKDEANDELFFMVTGQIARIFWVIFSHGNVSAFTEEYYHM